MCRRSGFTLIELLVVIAVIAILAAILFPVFARAREQARKIVCLSNVKQIGTAMQLYAQDYDETFPGWDDPVLHPFYGDWGRALLVPILNPYTKSEALWTCPSAPRTERFLRGPKEHRIYVHYGYNHYLFQTEYQGFPSYAGHWNRLAALAGSPAGVAHVALLADCANPCVFNDWTAEPGAKGLEYSGIGQLKYANGIDPGDWGFTRHMPPGASVVFADSHARFIQGSQMRGSYGTGNSAEVGGRIEVPVVNPLNIPPP